MDLEKFCRDNALPNLMADKLKAFRQAYPLPEDLASRVPTPPFAYNGPQVWRQALAAILSGANLLLTGPKATGKNVLAENLCALFQRPMWTISCHINVDATYLLGGDSFNGERVVFQKGPLSLGAELGGFVILDEINMARNEAMAVLHSALDFRRMVDIPGYQAIPMHSATRFIGTMNYGYAGTRELNEALASRFTILRMPEITEDQLTKLLQSKAPDLKPKILPHLVRLFLDLQRKAAHADITDRAVDLRGLMDALELIRQGLSCGEALEMGLVNKSFDPYEQGLIRDVLAVRLAPNLTAADFFEASSRL